MTFEFLTATRILFGAGKVATAGHIVESLGRRPFLVTGGSPDRFRPLLDAFLERGLACGHGVVTAEPTIGLVQSLLEEVRVLDCDVVVGFGGGSVLDTAKALAGLAPNSGEVLDYLEVIGRAVPLQQPALPCVAIPTTSGTGAEVTKNSVLGSPEHEVKVSLRSPYLLPRVALVDPDLTRSQPPSVTAFSGLDALTQVIEPFLGNRHNPLIDGLCREAIARGARALPAVFMDGSDAAAREDMCLVSLIGGLALTNAGLGGVHGFAGPLGGMIGAPHGAICACLLAPVVRANMRALEKRGDPDGLLQRFDEVGTLLTGDPGAGRREAVDWLDRCRRRLEVPPLRELGLDRGRLPEVVEKAQRASSMKGNPVRLTPDELTAILVEAMGPG